jgi:hypothetical protein
VHADRAQHAWNKHRHTAFRRESIGAHFESRS